MRTYIAGFPGVWIWGYAVVEARSEEEAIGLVRQEMKNAGLDYEADVKLEEVTKKAPRAIMVFDGNHY